jgi:RNA polymerase sigma-70 factor (ECF subfamily)
MDIRKVIPPKMTRTEEKKLIDRSKKDPKVFGRIYDAHFETIFNYILYRVGRVYTAEDLTAQTFYKALNNLWKFRWTGVPISAWLYRIASNEVNSYFRKRKNKTYTDINQIANQLEDETNRPDKELEAAEAVVQQHQTFLTLNSCIQQLKSDEQNLITMRYFEKKSFKEISEIMGKKEGTLRMRIWRALDKLKTMLEKQGIEDEAIRESIKRYTETQSGDTRIQAGSSPSPA